VPYALPIGSTTSLPAKRGIGDEDGIGGHRAFPYASVRSSRVSILCSLASIWA
jgi:hypothetical protein